MANRRGSRSGRCPCRRRCGSGRCRAPPPRRRAGPGRRNGRGPVPGWRPRTSLPRRASSRQSVVVQVAGGGSRSCRGSSRSDGGNGGRRPRARRGCRGAEDRVAVRMRRPQRLGVELEDEIVRRVGDAVDLFEHDVPLGLEIALAEQRPADQVGENVHRQAGGPRPGRGLVAGRVAPGVCVEAPPRTSSASARSRALRRSVPLNTMCSSRWEIPICSRSSWALAGAEVDPHRHRAHPGRDSGTPPGRWARRCAAAHRRDEPCPRGA